MIDINKVLDKLVNKLILVDNDNQVLLISGYVYTPLEYENKIKTSFLGLGKLEIKTIIKKDTPSLRIEFIRVDQIESDLCQPSYFYGNSQIEEAIEDINKQRVKFMLLKSKLLKFKQASVLDAII